jgi:hypothetical protein
VTAQPKLPRVIWAVPVALNLTGCFGWGPYEPAAPLSHSPGLPYRLRATLADSQQVELTSPFVRADTLYGRSGPQRDTVALAVGNVRALESEHLNLWRTLGLTVVAPAAALFAVFAIACGNGECSDQPTY